MQHSILKQVAQMGAELMWQAIFAHLRIYFDLLIKENPKGEATIPFARLLENFPPIESFLAERSSHYQSQSSQVFYYAYNGKFYLIRIGPLWPNAIDFLLNSCVWMPCSDGIPLAQASSWASIDELEFALLGDLGERLNAVYHGDVMTFLQRQILALLVNRSNQ